MCSEALITYVSLYIGRLEIEIPPCILKLRLFRILLGQVLYTNEGKFTKQLLLYFNTILVYCRH